jgi:type IV pilus assembly protein PilV
VKAQPHPRARGGCAGFSLVEILVALLVVGVGLLGLAGLQAIGARTGQSAQHRTLASIAANDLAERLRADADHALVGAAPAWSLAWDGCEVDPGTATILARWQSAFCGLGLPRPPDGDFARVDCSGSDVANTCGTGNCTILIRWDDSRGDSTAARAATAAGISLRDSERNSFRLCTRLAGG